MMCWYMYSGIMRGRWLLVFFLLFSIVLSKKYSAMNPSVQDELENCSQQERGNWLNAFQELLDSSGNLEVDKKVFLGKLYSEWLEKSGNENEQNDEYNVMDIDEVETTLNHNRQKDCKVISDIYISAGKILKADNSWRTYANATKNCCNCNGVTCRNNRVVGLKLFDLSGFLLPSLWDLSELEWLLMSGAAADGSTLENLWNKSNSIIRNDFIDAIQSTQDGNQLMGNIPELDNKRLEKLRTIVLSGNFMEGYVPKGMKEAFPNAEIFVLLGNWYCEIETVEFPNHAKIILLSGYFYGNLTTDYMKQITTSIVELGFLGYFENLEPLGALAPRYKNLSVIVISGDFHQAFPGKSFASFTNLTLLRIEGNFYGTEFPVLFELSSLESLYLFTNLECEIPRRISNLSSVVDLHLTGNFLGQIPDSIGSMTNLSTLKIDGNFNGDIPPLNKLKNLRILRIVGAFIGALPEISLLPPANVLQNLTIVGNFEGEVPPDFSEFTNLVRLNLVGNFAGHVPDVFHSYPNLAYLSLVGDFDGVLPEDLFRPKLTHLKIIGKYSGTLPKIPKGVILKDLIDIQIVGKLNGSLLLTNTGKAVPNLQRLSICCGLIIPRNTSLQNLTKVTYLDLAGNRIEGLQDPIDTMRSLEVLILDYCGLSNIGSLASLQRLRFLSLSHNNLTQYGDVLYPQLLQHVDLSYNNLSGLMMGFSRSCHYNFSLLQSASFANNHFDAFIITDSCPLPSLTNLDLSHNYLSGTLSPRLPSLFPVLRMANFSSNKLSGMIPSTFSRFNHLNVLDIRNNPNLKKGNDSKMYIATSDTSTSFRNSFGDSWRCPNLEVNTTIGTFSLVADDTFQIKDKGSPCKCDVGFYGNPSTIGCKNCDDVSPLATCPGNGTVYAPQGYWVSPPLDMSINQFPTNAIPCTGAGTSETVCRPDSQDYRKTCESGYTGRLCSKCDIGLSHIGGACIECVRGTFGKIFFAALVCILILVIVAMSFSRIVSSSGIVRVLIVFVQSLYYIIQRRRTSNLQFPTFISFLGHWNLPGPSCYFKSWSYTSTYITATVFPLVLLLLVAITYVFGELRLSAKFRYSPAKSELIQRWRRRCQHAVLFVIYFGFVGFSSEVVRPMTCDEDLGTKKMYMTNIPYESCNENLQLISSVLFSLFVLGLPVGVMIAYLKYGKPKQSSRLYLLSSIYSDKLWMWELLITGRRVLIIVEFLLLSMTSAFQSLAVFVTLGAALALQTLYSPFRERVENIFESVSLLVLIINYGVVLQYGSPTTDQGPAAIYVVLVLDAILIGLLVVELLTRNISKVKRWYAQKREQAMSREEYFGLRLIDDKS